MRQFIPLPYRLPPDHQEKISEVSLEMLFAVIQIFKEYRDETGKSLPRILPPWTDDINLEDRQGVD